VFVDRGNGYLEPREVETGEQVGDRDRDSQRSCAPGERVVTSANFLIDSESQLKAALWRNGRRSVSGAAGRPARADTSMIDRLIEFSARNRFVIFTLVAAAVLAGIWSLRNVPLDALPDLSDTQVIIYSRWDRSPDIIEDQVTYPIVTTMLGAPRVRAVRGFSDFGYSYVYVIFEDGTDIYWARSRTLEYLSGVLPRLPQGVRTELGPDATGLGWIFQYALLDRSGPAQPRGVTLLPGLVSALPPDVGPRRGRGGAGGRLRAPVPGQRGSPPIAGLQHPDPQGG
jgi:hypothetical protein